LLRTAADGLRRRPALAAALFYAALTIVFFGPGLLPGKTLSNGDTLWFKPPWVASKPAELQIPSNPDLGDAPDSLQLFLHRAAREMPDPSLWNANIMSGRPFAANGQSALFGPYTWPAYVLPFLTALGWIAVLKIWVAAFGTYLLARSLGLRFGGALLAGVVFALSLKLVTWVIYPAMGVWTWYPWLLLACDRLVRRADLLAATGLAAVVALQFLTGHPESSFHALVLTSCFLAYRLWQVRATGDASGRGAGRVALAFAGAVAGGAAVAAVSLLPLGELLLLSADYVDRRGASVDVSLPLHDAIGIFMPDWWGRPTQTPLRPILLERALYVGALPLMLAAAALALRPTRTRVAVATFGAFWAAVVLGIPPFVQVVTRLPLFSSGHNTRLIVFALLAVALLAGWGLDDLAAGGRAVERRGRVVAAAVAGLIAVPLLIVAVESPDAFKALGGGLRIAWLFVDPPGRFGDPQGQDVIRASALWIWLVVAAAGAALIALRLRSRLASGAFVTLALLVVCVDLFRAGMGQNPAIDRKYALMPETGAVKFLERQRPGRFVSTDEIPQNVIPMEFGLSEARGYDIPIVRRYDRLWRREMTPGGPTVAAEFLDIPLRLYNVTPRSLRTLRLLGVTHLLRAKSVLADRPPLDRLVPYPPLRLAGLTQVYDGQDARVYRIEGALPRAWLVAGQQVVGGGAEALATVTRPGFDARRVAVTEERLPGLRADGREPAAGAGTASIVSYGDDRVVVRARAQRSGLLVLNDTQYPGWRATVDGRPAPVKRVDYVLRGIPLPAGRHTVELRYEPLTWRIGCLVSVFATIGLAAAAALGLRRRRGPPDVRRTSDAPRHEELRAAAS
jgi:hypothetical protein